jgi:drug/metabolite transporter (DMT)-like permease
MTATAQRRTLTADGASTGAFSTADWGLLLVLASIWGASFLFIAEGLEILPPLAVGATRLALGVTTLSLIPKARVRVERSDLPRFALLGLTWMAGPLALFPLAEADDKVSSAVAGMLNGGIPIIATAISCFFLHRRPGRNQIGGILLGTVGIVTLSSPSLTNSRSNAVGVALIIVALCGYALSSNLSVPLTQRYGALPVQRMVQLFGLAYLGPFGLISALRSDDVTFKWVPVLSLLALGIVGTGAAFALAGQLFARVGAARGSIVGYIIPVVAIVLGRVFRSDQIKLAHLIGTGLVIGGAVLASRSERGTKS